MIERYSRPAMAAVWSDDRKLQLWLAVELTTCEAWWRRGRIPDWAIERIRGATCSLERARAIEREVDHDVIAFLRATGETIGEAARFVHLGLTSSDVVDTALALQMTQAADLIEDGLGQLRDAVGRQALAHKRTIMMGRTHGMHAEPITFGFKLAVWYDELARQAARLAFARAEIAVGKLSGAVGTHAHVPPDLEEEVCRALGLAAAPASTQVIQRDRHAFFFSVLAGIGGTVEKVAVEIRHLQRTEVREAEEPFDAGNQGSSAMPHKRNPHASERLCGLARLLRGYAVVAGENQALWHERDISHSSAERVILPDACLALDFMLHEATEIVERLTVYPRRMRENIDQTNGAVFSQPVLLALVDAGMDRTEAYKLVQRLVFAGQAAGRSLRDELAADPQASRLLDHDQMRRLFDPLSQLGAIDTTFDRVGLADSKHDEPRFPTSDKRIVGTTST